MRVKELEYAIFNAYNQLVSAAYIFASNISSTYYEMCTSSWLND